MYRKIIFISVNLFESISIFSKATLMLSFSFLSFLITFYTRPFILRKMNILELYSNLSSALTIFSGALYIMDVGEWLKAFCFMNVIIINGIFAYVWLSSMMNIVFDAHFETCAKYLPNLSMKFFALRETFSRIQFTFNLFFYFKSLKELYSLVLIELKSTKDENSRRTSRILVTEKIMIVEVK